MAFLERKEVQADAFLDQGQSGLPSLFGNLTGSALYPDPNFGNHVDHAFQRNEIVYACIMEKATSLPEAPLRVYFGDGMGEPRENHPLRLLISTPNPVLTEFELIEMTAIHLDLAGNAFWEIVLDKNDTPVELWPLRPDRVRIIPKRDGNHQYAYLMGSGKLVPLGPHVVHFKMPNPSDPYVGQAPLRPALRAVSLDNEATDFVKVLLQNRAVPGAVIETEQKLDEELANRLTQKWMDRFGKNRNGKPAFLQKGMKVTPLGLNLRDLEFPDLRTISETRICSVLGVPPILIGAKSGLDRSTFANYAEARSSFWEETLMPLQHRIAQVVAKKLMPYFEGPRPRRTLVQFDNSNVRALRESEGKRWELATQALRAGGITVNQFNRYIGLPTVEGGDVYLRPAGVIPTDAAGNPTIDLPSTTDTTQDPTATGSGSDPAALDSGRSSDGTGEPKALVVGPTAGKSVAAATRASFTKALSDYVDEQAAEVLADLAKSSARILYTKAWDEEKWDRKLADLLGKHTKRVARASARRVDRDANVEKMDRYLERAANRTAQTWNNETRRQVTEAAKGSDWQEKVAAVFALAAGARATTLATTMATEADGFGAVDTAKAAGRPYKTWVVTSSNPRPAHAALDGESVPIGDTFSNGARWPGDSALDDDERAGCQCSVIFEEGN